MENHLKFSIIILTYAREKELEACLKSLHSQDIPYRYETIVVFNGETSYFDSFKSNFPDISFHKVPKTTPAEARNFALELARGEYLFFVDDDCEFPDGYFSKLDFDRDWDVLGGPDRTPPSSGWLQIAVGETITSPLCMGPTYSRHSPVGHYSMNADEKMLILCNLWFRRSVFTDHQLKFNKDLFRNEENFLLKEIQKLNKKIHYDPELFIYHKRKSLKRLAVSTFKSGEYRIRSFFLAPTWQEGVYFVPLLTLTVLSLLSFYQASLVALLAILYTFVVCLYSLWKFKGVHILFLIFHYYIILFYSVGSLWGIYRVVSRTGAVTPALNNDSVVIE